MPQNTEESSWRRGVLILTALALLAAAPYFTYMHGKLRRAPARTVYAIDSENAVVLRCYDGECGLFRHVSPNVVTWQRRLGELQMRHGDLSGHGDTVVSLAGDVDEARVIALDIDTGEIRWSHALEGSLARLHISGDSVVVSSRVTGEVRVRPREE